MVFSQLMEFQLPQIPFLFHSSMPSMRVFHLPKSHLLFLTCSITSSQGRLLFLVARLSLHKTSFSVTSFLQNNDSTQKIVFIWMLAEGEIQEMEVQEMVSRLAVW